jgi:hypothetical protein
MSGGDERAAPTSAKGVNLSHDGRDRSWAARMADGRPFESKRQMTSPIPSFDRPRLIGDLDERIVRLKRFGLKTG